MPESDGQELDQMCSYRATKHFIFPATLGAAGAELPLALVFVTTA